MSWLSGNELSALRNAVLNTVGYHDHIRRIFLSEVNSQFRNLLYHIPMEMAQLDSDLIRLNQTERLTDGSIALQSWLNKAAQYVQQIPESNKIVQEALAKIEGTAVKSEPVLAASPTDIIINRIVQEKIILQNDMVSYAFLEAGWKAGIGVVRLQVPRYNDDVPATSPVGGSVIYSGTGWLLTKELLITNHHVINARSESEADAVEEDFSLQAENSYAEFDFNADNIMPHRVGIEKLEVANKDLDFAILRLNTQVERLSPLRLPTEIVASPNHPQVVNIIQHPFGHSKKVAFRNNHIFEATYPKVFYFTDTEKGSSGSPVFNDNWQVVALHRASKLIQDVEYLGKSTGWVNEGIQLKAIFDLLEKDFPDLNTEILSST